MLPKFAETLNPQRLGLVNRATDLDEFRQRLEQGASGISNKDIRQMKMAIDHTREIGKMREQAKANFDKEANEKDLVGRDRRGMEAAIEYQLRREAGIPPKNERDDPNSPYSLRNIEDGLMTREAIEGIEYAVFYDKDGETVGIFKGQKGCRRSSFQMTVCPCSVHSTSGIPDSGSQLNPLQIQSPSVALRTLQEQ